MSPSRMAKEVVALLPDPALLIDGDGKVLAFNQACSALTGMPMQRLSRSFESRSSVFEIVRSQRGDRYLEAALTRATPIHWHEVGIHIGDALLDEALLTLMPLPNPESAQTAAIIFTIRDTSAEAQTQRKLKEMLARERERGNDLERCVRERTQELEESRRAAEEAAQVKGEFLAVMSHELRTPINGISGIVALLLERADLLDDVREELQVVHDSAMAMAELLNDGLDASKLDAGRLELEDVVFSLPELIRSLSAMARRMAETADVMWKLELGSQLPHWLRGDPTRLRQILTNLIGNAIKFSRGGSVTLHIEAGDHREGASQAQVLFSVRDTGIGVAPEKCRTIFEAFTQADSSTTRRYGGTGLGLSISQQLVQLMGSTISLESELGVGSEFSFTVGFEKAAAPERPECEPMKLPGVRILLVEDNPVNQKVASRMLELLECQVDVAGDGETGLELALQKRYDVILMDCQMPVLDGFETTRRIRQSRRGSHDTPVVALTANIMPGIREECRAAGMSDYLSKPIRKQELVAILGKWSGETGAPSLQKGSPS